MVNIIKIASSNFDFLRRQNEDKRELLDYLQRSESFLNSLVYQTDKPVLLLWGGQDRLIPPDVGRPLQQLIGDNARLEFIPAAAHAPNVERAGPFNKAVLKFLENPKPKKEKTKKN